MKTYNIEHLFEQENINEKTECLCQLVVGKDRKVRIHNHDFYDIFLTLTETYHFINGKTEIIPRGTLVFVKPSDIHGILYDLNENCEIINFSFSSRLVGLIADFLGISKAFVDNMKSPRIRLDEIESKRLSERLKKLISEQQDIILIRCALFELFSLFLNTNPTEEKLFPAWFGDMCESMKLPENFIAGTSRMIEISGKSREYISRSMKKFLGITPTEFVNRLRLSHSASLIINTRLSITEISALSGFESVSWFNKLFTEKYGMSPNNFRKKERHYESTDI